MSEKKKDSDFSNQIESFGFFSRRPAGGDKTGRRPKKKLIFWFLRKQYHICWQTFVTRCSRDEFVTRCTIQIFDIQWLSFVFLDFLKISFCHPPAGLRPQNPKFSIWFEKSESFFSLKFCYSMEEKCICDKMVWPDFLKSSLIFYFLLLLKFSKNASSAAGRPDQEKKIITFFKLFKIFFYKIIFMF